MARRARRRNGRAGFVLIEVLVAVGIAAVLMAALMRAFVNTWSGINVVREEAEGTLLARSMLDETLLRGQFQPGTQEGTLGRYAWTIVTTMQTVTTVAPAQPQSKNNDDNNDTTANARPGTATIYHVAVVLRGPGGRSNRLDAFKIGQTAQ
jgi:prepilin-type N-terminal cleavage/methylation domain-containing protein